MGIKCYPGLDRLPDGVGGVIAIVPTGETEKVCEEMKKCGLNRIWMQQGAQSENAIQFCKENGIDVVANECILMFAEPTAFMHRLHRGIWRILEKLLCYFWLSKWISINNLRKFGGIKHYGYGKI